MPFTKRIEFCERKKSLAKVDEIDRIYLPKTVLFGFIATWFLAASPIKRSVSVKAT